MQGCCGGAPRGVGQSTYKNNSRNATRVCNKKPRPRPVVANLRSLRLNFNLIGAVSDSTKHDVVTALLHDPIATQCHARPPCLPVVFTSLARPSASCQSAHPPRQVAAHGGTMLVNLRTRAARHPQLERRILGTLSRGLGNEQTETHGQSATSPRAEDARCLRCSTPKYTCRI